MGRDPCREREDHYHRHKCAFPASGALLKKPPPPSPHHHLPPAKSDDHAKIPRLAVCAREVGRFLRYSAFADARIEHYFFLDGRPEQRVFPPSLSLSLPKAEVERGEYYAERKGGSPYIREISHGQERGDDDKCSVFMQVGKRKEGRRRKGGPHDVLCE